MAFAIYKPYIKICITVFHGNFLFPLQSLLTSATGRTLLAFVNLHKPPSRNTRTHIYTQTQRKQISVKTDCRETDEQTAL